MTKSFSTNNLSLTNNIIFKKNSNFVNNLAEKINKPDVKLSKGMRSYSLMKIGSTSKFKDIGCVGKAALLRTQSI